MAGGLDLYCSGDYLQRNPLWHVEESPWKAQQILRMLARHHISPRTIAEVGCGAGEVLRQLQTHLPQDCVLWGYDISPQAIALCQTRANERLQFKLADIRQEPAGPYDLLLVLDVVEHVEDYFSLLRDIQAKSRFTILHIPLELSVQAVARRRGLLNPRAWYGHLHYFTREIALQVVQEVGYEVVDYVYTARALEVPSKALSRRLLKLPRRLFFAMHQDLAVRILGGYSLLILAHGRRARGDAPRPQPWPA